MKRQRLEIMVTGRVQGVNFRSQARRQAERLGLTGEAMNRPDGRVSIIAEGARTPLEQLLEWVRQGPPEAVVESVVTKWLAATGQFGDFQVRR